MQRKFVSKRKTQKLNQIGFWSDFPCKEVQREQWTRCVCGSN